jgi:anti-sigma B factor antagonist
VNDEKGVAEPGLLLNISGDLDISTVPDLRRRLDRAIASGARGIVVDLSEVTFVDSLSLAMLVAAKHRLGPEGRLAVVADNPFVILMLQASGADRVLDTFGDRSTAREFALV